MRFLSVILFAAVAAVAADVSFEGSLEADYANFLEKDFTVQNKANHDLRLKMLVDFDENIRVVLGAASKSGMLRNRFESADIADSNRWNSQFSFDGITLEWTVWRGLTFLAGDLFYSAGSFNYYYWRNADYYAAIVTTQSMRGLGVRLGKDGYVYVGASDVNNTSGRIAAGYSVEIPGLDQTDNKFVLTPMFDFIVGRERGRAHRYTIGLDGNYSRSYTDLNYAVRGMWGMHTMHSDYVNTFAVEPSFNYKQFSLAGLGYWAILADVPETDKNGEPLVQTREPIDQIYTPDKMLVYVEPSYSITKKFSFGVAGEWHRPIHSKDDWFFIAPTGYLYPTAGVELVLWVGYAIKEINYKAAEEKGRNNPSFGVSTSVIF